MMNDAELHPGGLTRTGRTHTDRTVYSPNSEGGCHEVSHHKCNGSLSGRVPGVVLHRSGEAVTISEIRIDQPSTDNDEYFELAGAAGTSMNGLTYLVIGDGTGGSGVIEAVVDLTGQSIPPAATSSPPRAPSPWAPPT